MPCDDQEVWDGTQRGWRGSRGRGCTYTYVHTCVYIMHVHTLTMLMIHVAVQQKLTQYCKAIIFRFLKELDPFCLLLFWQCCMARGILVPSTPALEVQS